MVLPIVAPRSGAYAFEIAKQDYARNGRIVLWATAENQALVGGVLVFAALSAVLAPIGPNDSSWSTRIMIFFPDLTLALEPKLPRARQIRSGRRTMYCG
jgi:hypothetical protein